MRNRCVSSPYTKTTPFGYVEGYPLNGGFHTGVDYISDGRILSPMDSVVMAIGHDSTNGNYLVLESGGYRDWFSHIKTNGYKVSKGQLVAIGQYIADQGETGAADGVHVHHSLRINGGPLVDAEQYITEGGDMQEEIDRLLGHITRREAEVKELKKEVARLLGHVKNREQEVKDLKKQLGTEYKPYAGEQLFTQVKKG